MVVKVYGSVRAACPQRVMACLMEFDVDFELINVDLDSNEHKQPDFLKKQVHFILHTICYNLQYCFVQLINCFRCSLLDKSR